MATVPAARRMLLSDRRRALLGVLGVAVALVLALALDGIFIGSTRQVSRYIDTSPADVFVSQEGVRTMHMSVSVLPESLVGQIQSLPGVAWAEPILFTSEALQADTGRRPTYVFGYRPGGPSGPGLLVAGTEPGPGEMVADEAAAAALGIEIGDRAEVMGRTWTVSGLSSGLTSIINTAVFVRYDDLASVMGRATTASYVLVGSDGDANAVAEQIRAAVPGVEVLTRPSFSAEERALVAQMSTDLMGIMSIAAFLVGLAVIGLVLYATVLARLRELGVMKALGLNRARITRLVLTQAAWTVGSAVLVAVAITALIAAVISAVTPDIDLAITPSSVLRTAAAAVVVGVAGALVPVRRVLRIDPASVFRRPT